MAGPAARIAGSQAAPFVNHPLPGQIRISKMGDAADDPRRPGVPAQRGYLAIGHYPALRDLRHQRLHPLPKAGVNLFHQKEVFKTRVLTSLAMVFINSSMPTGLSPSLTT